METAAVDAGMNDIGKIKKFMFHGINLNDPMAPIMEERGVHENVFFTHIMITTTKIVEVAKEVGIQYMGLKKVMWDLIVHGFEESNVGPDCEIRSPACCLDGQ